MIPNGPYPKQRLRALQRQLPARQLARQRALRLLILSNPFDLVVLIQRMR